MPNVAISSLPAAGPLTGTELVPIVQQGVTVQTTTANISAAPNLTQTFLTVNNEISLPNSRYFSTGIGLGLTDDGAQSYLRLTLNGTAGSLEAAGLGLIAKTAANTVAARAIAVSSPGLSVSNATGVAGDPTLSLSGLAAALASLGGTGIVTIQGGTTASTVLVAGTADQIDVANGNGVGGNPTISLSSNPTIPGTGGMIIPAGTTVQQPVGSAGQIRFNTDDQKYYGFASGAWSPFTTTSSAVTSFSAGTTGFSPSIPTTGNVVLSGILNPANGGTGINNGTKTITLGGNFSTAGAFSLTLTTTGGTNVTLPTTGTLATLDGVEVLTNKTISGTNNTLSNIGNASLVNSSVTYNGVTVSLGGAGTITAVNPNALTVGTGLQLNAGTTYDGSAAKTISIDSTVATLAGAQILTNKTIDGGNNTLQNIGNASLTNSSITLGSTTVSLGGTALTLGGLTSVTVTQDPTTAYQLATKQYVDGLVSTGLYYHSPVQAATTQSLAAQTGGTVTYNNGAGGVGATITLSVSLNTLDGYTLANTNRILVKDEVNAAYNGVYTWATGGTVLTRSTDTDSYGPGPGDLSENDYFFVQNGTVNKGNSYVCTTSGTITFGTTAIDFAQFSTSQVYTAGTGLTLTGTQFSITSTGVTAASYGAASKTLTATVNAQGQLTALADTPIAIANTQVSGLGTMSTQNANSVAITGGTIDNVAIGSGTATTGKFTDLTDSSLTSGRVTYAGTGGNLVDSASLTFDGTTLTTTQLTSTGTSNLGGDATTPALVAVAGAGNTRWLTVAGSASANVQLSIGGAGNGNLALVPRGTGGVSLNSGASATNTQFFAAHTASAVNYVQVTGAAQNGSPTISAQGSDAGIALRINAKGGSQVILSGNGVNTAFQTSHVTNAVNYYQAAPSAAGFGIIFSAQGNDSNISQVFQSKGTGAIDLAAGSTGVNISNGGTVTAITRTASGSGYTSLPSVAISAPTTAGGVQATATCTLGVSSATIGAGGTGYTLNDVITVSGGTFGTAAVCTVSGVSGGVVTAVTFTSFGTYTVLPTNPASTTGGTGTGLTLNLGGTFVNTGFTITNAGSGYVEQPTVSFSGGGGSGAAAYATVGSGTTVKSLGSTMSFSTPGGEQVRINDTSATATDYLLMQGGVGASVNPSIQPFGSTTNSNIRVASRGTGAVLFLTNGAYGQLQAVVSHTASAVNYVQVTGAATGSGNYTTISSQGSDSAVNLRLSAKGTATLDAQVNSTTRWKINSDGSVDSGISASGGVSFKASATASQVNYLQSAGGVATQPPVLSAQGSDTDIAQVFQSKGAGAIDLAAGTNGVNVSNGGTVTAITRTATGGGYTSVPSVTVSAPTTSGGVQATLSLAMYPQSATVVSGGTGYTVGDTLTVSGGTFVTAAQLTVSTVSAGVITAVTVANTANYSVLPTNPASVTGGTGTGATFNLSSGIVNITITNAGSGYVEQPTVTFSGGGGSGAAAYAVVGSGTVIRSIGFSGNQGIDFAVPGSVGNSGFPVFRIRDTNIAAGTNAGYVMVQSNNGYAQIIAQGVTNAGINLASAGTGSINLNTNGGNEVTQLRVANTSSAVNYVQVTGAATSNSPQILFTGSDAGVGGALIAKSNGAISFFNNGATSSRQFRIGAGGVTTAVNYINADGSATGNATQFQTLGTDANIAMALRTSGTGAIDLAAGSSGVNISNGGTVTAITGTAAGSGYTSIPSVAITAPTTAGGVQATATVGMSFGTISIASGGSGYTAGDVLTVTASAVVAAIITVSTVSAGVITAVTLTSGGTYTTLPSTAVSVTGGTGSGATFNVLTYAVRTNAFTITNAGSGYVEQPTVSFSGGGGSGAAAYATVGSGTVVRSLSTMSFFVPGGEAFRISENGVQNPAYVNTFGSAGTAVMLAAGTGANLTMGIVSKGTNQITFATNGTTSNEQLRVSHTASAVNYVQVTGAGTGNPSQPIISAQGSDANINIALQGKGTGAAVLLDSGGGGTIRAIPRTTGGDTFLDVRRDIGFVDLIASSSVTDGDVRITPKGAGLVRFGTYTAGAPTATGYISIKAADGTTYKILVST